MFSAPNFTCTPNIFFDEIIQTLNEGELRVILIIIRQTLGWGKKSDWMTYSLLAKKTGYERRAVIAILGRLIQKNLVSKIVTGNSGHQKCYFSLAIDRPKKEDEKEDEDIETEEERKLLEKAIKESYKEINTGARKNTTPNSKKIVTGAHTSTTPVLVQAPPQCSAEHSTKETLTKETKTKLSVTAGGAAVLERQDQEEEFSEEGASSENTTLPNEITITTTGNKKLKVTQSDIYAYVVGQKIECTTEAIRYAWKALCECECIVHDWNRFISGTIKNYKNKKRSVNISKAKQKDITDDEIEREVERIKQQNKLDDSKEESSQNLCNLLEEIKKAQKG